MKSLSEAKLRYSFPKDVKFHFALLFWVILRFYHQFHCKIYVWTWCGLSLIFILVISIILPFQVKKSQISNILPTWGSVASGCQQSFKNSQLVWTLTPDKFSTECPICLIFTQIIIFLPLLEITSLYASGNLNSGNQTLFQQRTSVTNTNWIENITRTHCRYKHNTLLRLG